MAEFARRHLPDELLKNPNYLSLNYEKALKEAFMGIDKLLESEAGRAEIAELSKERPATLASQVRKNPNLFGDEGPEGKGCTANVILLKNRYLYIANSGDSRAVVAVKGLAIDLSFDHKPDNEKEKNRITKAGGTVTNGRVEGNLNLSRALGDLRYKKDKTRPPEEQIISAEPEVHKQPLLDSCDFIVMGCDGIFETKSSQNSCVPANICTNIQKNNITLLRYIVNLHIF